MTMKGSVIRKTYGERIFNVVNIFILTLLAFIMLYPLWDCLIASISPASYASQRGLKLFPEAGISMDAYRYVFSTDLVLIGYKNTLIRTIVGTALSIIVYFLTAYPLSKTDLFGRKFFSLYFLIPMFFTGGLVPNYLLIKDLGLLDSIWSLILPMLLTTYNLLIVRNFISAIPESMEESARIDGANSFIILTRIIIPLSMPVLATISLWVAVDHWNAWFDASIYCHDKNLMVLAKYLRQVLINAKESTSDSVSGDVNVVTRSVEGATILVAIIPILCVYPFVQRYFVKGVMIGAVKG